MKGLKIFLLLFIISLANIYLFADEICGDQLSPKINFKKLTSFDARSEFPIFSPDGKSILFLSNYKKEREICFDVWQVSLDGSKLFKVIDFDVNTNPKLADPGIFPKLSFFGNSNELFVYEAKNIHEIFKVNLSNIEFYPLVRKGVDGEEKHFELIMKVPAGLMASNIEYSPATGMAVWSSFSWTKPVPYQIRFAPFKEIIGEETNKVGKVLLTVEDGKVNTFSISPDGKYLAVSAILEGLKAGIKPDIYIFDLENGTAVKNLTQTGKNGIACYHPEWSPNGEWLSYTVEYKNKKVILLHNIKTNKILDLTSSLGNCYGAVWSPDGTSLAFTYESGKSTNIVIAENIFDNLEKTKSDEISNIVEDDAEKTLSLSVEPNPATEIATIHFSTIDDSPVSIKIVNNLGNEIATYNNLLPTRGKYILPLDITGYTSGVYYIILSQGNFSKSEKFMIAK